MTASRLQRSIRQPVELSGIGLFTDCDTRLRFLPAGTGRGIVFRRVDLPDSPEVPASLVYVESTERRTSLVKGPARVELTEHVLAALAGLQIDNCTIEIDAAEVPGMDGSCREFVEALQSAGIVEQDAPRRQIVVDRKLIVEDDRSRASTAVQPHYGAGLVITYHLDYGPRSPIPPQTRTVEVTPEEFTNEICFARTFILESEVAALRAQGYGTRTTARDLLVYGPDGVIDNQLRRPDECVRHKILDCIGDLALLGCDLRGHVTAWRSGHRMNQRLAEEIQQQYLQEVRAA